VLTHLLFHCDRARDVYSGSYRSEGIAQARDGFSGIVSLYDEFQASCLAHLCEVEVDDGRSIFAKVSKAHVVNHSDYLEGPCPVLTLRLVEAVTDCIGFRKEAALRCSREDADRLRSGGIRVSKIATSE
jgi:hypothetical protein